MWKIDILSRNHTLIHSVIIKIAHRNLPSFARTRLAQTHIHRDGDGEYRWHSFRLLINFLRSSNNSIFSYTQLRNVLERNLYKNTYHRRREKKESFLSTKCKERMRRRKETNFLFFLHPLAFFLCFLALALTMRMKNVENVIEANWIVGWERKMKN
jgi:hypothetical protein